MNVEPTTRYDYKRSRERIDEILNNSNTSFIEGNSEIMVTFDNGLKRQIDVIVVDMRSSSLLSELMGTSSSDEERVDILRKIYGAYISEVIAAFRANENIEKIYIEGDGLWAVFKSNNNTSTDLVFGTATRVSSIVETINTRLRENKYPYIRVGIGIETGFTYYIKGGLKGTGINEEVWVGNIVSKAFKYCDMANKKPDSKVFKFFKIENRKPLKEIVLSPKVYNVLRNDQKKLLKYHREKNVYHGSVYDKKMHSDWLKDNNPKAYQDCGGKKFCYYKLDEKETVGKRITLSVVILLVFALAIVYFFRG